MSGRLCLVILIALATVDRACADLQFREATVVLGDVRAGGDLTHEFPFANGARSAIDIVAVRPGCGCLKPQLAKTRFEPHQAGVIPVQIRTLGQAAGPHTWQLHVVYRADGVLKERTLQIKARVVTEVQVTPAALTIDASQPAVHEIVLTDLRQAPLKIEAVKTSAAHVVARLLDAGRTDQGHWRFPIRVEVGQQLPDGRHDETLHIYTSDPMYRHLHVPIALLKAPRSRLVAQPAEVTLRAARGQPIPARLVRLADRDGNPVEVDKIRVDHAALVCTTAAGPGNAVTLRIQIDAAKLAGTSLSGTSLNGTVQVEARQPRREIVSIRVQCHVE